MAIQTDNTGRSVLSYEVTGRISRIPLERRGTYKGNGWVLGSVLLEAYDEDRKNSARLFLTTFDEELIETLNLIGVGKDVKVRYHVEVRDGRDSYRVSLVLDEIHGLTENEDYLMGTKK